MADDGTIFLDEIGEMTLRMQGLLLRFLETGELQKVGADRDDGRVNVRVIAATNRNLRDMIAQGLFREDLFYRLNVIHLIVPPLRERREDIPVAHRALPRAVHANHQRRRSREIAPEAMKALTRLLLAGQRPRARERHRAAGRARPGEHGRRSTTCRPRSRTQRGVGIRPKRERRRTVADDLYKRLIEERESFWTAVYPLYMQREITRGNVRDWCARGSRRRAATTRSWRASSTWSRATTSGS